MVGGIRTTKDELLAVINDPKHYVFIYPKTTTSERDGKETGELLGCIAVDIKDDVATNQRAGNQKAYIGMFAVLPELQGLGTAGPPRVHHQQTAVRSYGHCDRRG